MALRIRRRVPKVSPLSRSAGAQPARPAQLREMNCRTLLRLLRAHSPCSKADLVRMSGLTAPTVSMAAARMAELGLVEAIGEGESSGGRPPGLLRFNAAHRYVAGADIGGTRVRMVLADLNGAVVARWSIAMTPEQKSTEGVVSLVGEGLRAMTREAGAGGRVLHLTAGAPGITDVCRGVVVSAPNLAGWDNVPLRSMLERETGVAAAVENDTNLAAEGEFARGVAAGVENFIFVAVGTGVGAGVFLRGALYHGRNWSAGEIGYLPVEGEGRATVRMRETGQLERVLGGEGIEARWRKLLSRDGRTGEKELMGMRAPRILDLAGQDSARQGQALGMELLCGTARLLADALSTLALLYDPELIVLGGGVGSHAALCREAERFLGEHEFAVPRLRSSSLGTEAQLHGAVSLSLQSTEAKLLCWD